MQELIDGLLREAEEIGGHTVAQSSRNVYEGGMRTYERVLKEVTGMEPYPIDVQKMEIFIVYMRRQNRAYNTLSG